MENTIAAKYFHGKERFNCCQAVLKAYADNADISDDYIHENFAKYGGGRAPEGMCGALYAAVLLLKDQPEELNKIADEFTKSASSANCRDIRKAGTLHCIQCVELVGQMLEDKQIPKMQK